MAEVVCGCESEVEVAKRAAGLIEKMAQSLRPRFRRAAAHRHAVDYLKGLVGDVERKNGWQLAEYVGYRHPRGIQRVLDRYAWDADLVRDDLRCWVMEELGDPDGVLVIDETGFPKKGRHSVGVARQYCSTLGKIDNCQVGVFLGYASPKGRAAIDRALYIPEEWFEEPERCRKAGVPEGLGFRSKPELALQLIERALDGGVYARWVVADEVYGSDGKLRHALEERGQAYVLAVRSNEKPSTWPPYGMPGRLSVAELAEALPADGWKLLSCGEGAQGPRVYEWAYIPLRPALRQGWVHSLLLRRHPERQQELAYYLVYAPEQTPLQEVVRAAGARWSIEEMFKLGKGQVGLDHYEVRSWQGWYRHITLALVALAALAIGAAKKGGVPSTSPSPSLKSEGCSFGSSSPPPESRRMSCSGPGGADTTRRSPSSATAVAA